MHDASVEAAVFRGRGGLAGAPAPANDGRNGDAVDFFVISWLVVDPPFQRGPPEPTSSSKSTLRLTGVTPSGLSVCIDVPELPCIFYSTLGYESIRDHYINHALQQFEAKFGPGEGDYEKWVARKRAQFNANFDALVVSSSTVERKFLQGIRGPATFTRIECADSWARRNLYKACAPHTAHEKVEPMLAYRVETGIKASSWVRATGVRFGASTSSKTQIYARAVKLEPLSDVPMSVPPLLVNSMDIECYSSTGDFPKAENRDDFISVICCNFSRAHESNGPAMSVAFAARASEPIEGVMMRAHESEEHMLKDFVEFCGRVHAEVWLTYNGFGFDWGYIYHRCKRYHIDMRRMGAFMGSRPLELTQKDKRDGRKMAYFDIAGALNLDTFIPIGDNFKLASYKLDNVASHFLGLNKIDLSPAEMFAKTTQGPAAIREIIEYCVRDVELPLQLAHKLSLVLNLLAESETVDTTLNDLVTRGQGIKIFSVIAGLCKHNGDVLISDEPMHYDFLRGQKYEGAFVQEPLRADDGGVFHSQWPVVALDVGSLYPTIIRTFNLCFSTYQQDPTQTSAHPRTFSWIEHDRQETHTFDQYMHALLPQAMRDMREQRQAVRAQKKKEVDPTIQMVLEARQLAIKVVMNSLYGSLGAGEKSALPCVPIAKTITYMGREIIKECARYTTTMHGFRCVYIDTDSTYIEVRNDALKDNPEGLLRYAFDVGSKLEKEVSEHIRQHFNMVDPEAFVLEHEDTIKGLLIPSKKRYCARLYKSPSEKGKLLIKGLTVKRRDAARLVQGLLERILQQAIDVRDKRDAKAIIVSEMDQAFGALERGEVPLEDLQTSKALRAKYEATPPVHWHVAEKRRARGETVKAGERVFFVFVKVPHERAVKTQGDRAEDPAYVREHPELEPDGAFYIESQVRGPAEQLLSPFWPGVGAYLRQWQARFRGQGLVTNFFAPAQTTAPQQAVGGKRSMPPGQESESAPASADAAESSEPVQTFEPEFKRRRPTSSADMVPCELDLDLD